MTFSGSERSGFYPGAARANTAILASHAVAANIFLRGLSGILRAFILRIIGQRRASMINKLLVVFAALMLASFIGAGHAAAQVSCDPTNPAADCDGDGIPNGQDTCDNLDPNADCDHDGVANGVDQCPATVVGADVVIGACTLTGFGNTISPTGCSLAESIADTVQDCADGAKNHGKFVSCVSHATNTLKKMKLITGKQKGQIQSCAAEADIP
jgi:hypothetical protein